MLKSSVLDTFSLKSFYFTKIILIYGVFLNFVYICNFVYVMNGSNTIQLMIFYYFSNYSVCENFKVWF